MSDALFDAVDAPCELCGRPMATGRCLWCDPVLPYYDNTSSGWSGSDTSRERAEKRDSSGETARAQAAMLKVVAAHYERGITVAEARDIFPGHHGTLSGVLSNLHAKGSLARLKNKRGGCKVYVLPGFVMGRETEPHKSATRKKCCPNCGWQESA
jgi:hypothetical protein